MHFGADFDALIARFSPPQDKAIALAVSGGSDSLALLHLADKWASQTGCALHVFTVDHQLRLAAKAEASGVAALCKRLGHRHDTLTWSVPKPVQNAARHARYQLICAAMRSRGLGLLLTGHTLDDVVETALIRRRRGVRDATAAGPVLAAPAPVWPEGRGIALLRPLIRQNRASLRETLSQEHWAWVDDPSNESDQFERVRVRQFLRRQPRLNVVATDHMRRVVRRRLEGDNALSEAISQVTVRCDGVIDTGTATITPRLLAILARCASGGAREPRGSMVRDLIRTLIRPGARQTLGGAWFQKTKTGIQIGRDPGASLNPYTEQLFDGRFEPAVSPHLPDAKNQGVLVRQSAPPGPNWREIISDRLSHMALCYGTPDLRPVIA